VHIRLLTNKDGDKLTGKVLFMSVDATKAFKRGESDKETDGMPVRLDCSQPSRNCNNELFGVLGAW
jgi:hypothetical protein